MCGGGDDTGTEKEPNRYLESLLDTKPRVRTRSNDLADRLDRAKTAFDSGAWIGGTSEDFAEDLRHRRNQLDISGNIALSAFSDEIRVQDDEPEVDADDWRATFSV
ncbi:hypothetical protein [Brevibacterium litoralis]|uniref:hypothetical protein n=1 Tax=Brevibacterium litoralis TaxID=3138935 RepID=UPI0032EEDC69